MSIALVARQFSDNSNLDNHVLGYFMTMSVWEEGKGSRRVQEPGIGHYNSTSQADNLTSRNKVELIEIVIDKCYILVHSCLSLHTSSSGL